ncbi:MAG: MotA/TolQ/ExbB proton channel family protein [Myxococcales bacterium]
MTFGPIDAVLDFLERGGDVLYVILAVTAVMWALIVERILYFRGTSRRDVQNVIAEWGARAERTSWCAGRIRQLLIAGIYERMRHSLPLIKGLVGICPLLGLLGTVTGMIEVFDVMAVAGTGNARAMASGVSKATIPTMAGLVAALSGLTVNSALERFANAETERVADHLTQE